MLREYLLPPSSLLKKKSIYIYFKTQNKFLDKKKIELLFLKRFS